MMKKVFFDLKNAVPTNQEIGTHFEIQYLTTEEYYDQTTSWTVEEKGYFKVVEKKLKSANFGKRTLLEGISTKCIKPLLSKEYKKLINNKIIIKWRYVTKKELWAFL